LAERFPATSVNFAKATGHFFESKELLDELARMDLAAEPETFPLAIKHIASLSDSRRRNLLRYLLSIHGVRIPSEAKFHELLRQMLEAAPDRHPQIIFGTHRLYRRKGNIYLELIGECEDNS
jgi:tRNA(Ile)-lysidine synthase